MQSTITYIIPTYTKPVPLSRYVDVEKPALIVLQEVQVHEEAITRRLVYESAILISAAEKLEEGAQVGTIHELPSMQSGPQLGNEVGSLDKLNQTQK